MSIEYIMAKLKPDFSQINLISFDIMYSNGAVIVDIKDVPDLDIISECQVANFCSSFHFKYQ